MNAVEGEAVARQSNRNRAWTRIDANFWERGRLDRRVRRPAKHIPVCFFFSGAGRETRPAATRRSEQHRSGPLCGLVALPKDRISQYSRLLAFIRDSVRKSLISRIGLTQVVDFHDISGYFSWFWRCSFAVMVQFLKVPKQLMQVVDFHDIFQ